MQRDPTEVLDRRIIAHVIDSLVTALGAAAIWWSRAQGIPKLLLDENGSAVIEETIGEDGLTVTRYLVQGSDEPMALSSSDITAVPTWLGDDVYVFQFWGVFVAALVGLSFLVHVVLQGFTGLTPGKLLTGIRTVKRSGGKPGILRSFVRWLMLVIPDGLPVPLLVPLIGFLVALFARGHRRLGDLLAGTFVVSKDLAGRAIDVDGSFVVAREPEDDRVATTERSVDRSVATGSETADSADDFDLDADSTDIPDEIAASSGLRDEPVGVTADASDSPFAPPAAAAGVAAAGAGALAYGSRDDVTLEPDEAFTVDPSPADPAGVANAELPADDLDTTADFDTLAHNPTGDVPAVTATTPSDTATTTFETAPPSVDMPASTDSELIDLTTESQVVADEASPTDREPALVAARTDEHEVVEATSSAGAETAEQTWVYEPEWDAARNAYIVWDARRQEWLQFDDASSEWGPISQ